MAYFKAQENIHAELLNGEWTPMQEETKVTGPDLNKVQQVQKLFKFHVKEKKDKMKAIKEGQRVSNKD